MDSAVLVTPSDSKDRSFFGKKKTGRFSLNDFVPFNCTSTILKGMEHLFLREITFKNNKKNMHRSSKLIFIWEELALVSSVAYIP